jgi:hypothetical protein
LSARVIFFIIVIICLLLSCVKQSEKTESSSQEPVKAQISNDENTLSKPTITNNIPRVLKLAQPRMHGDDIQNLQKKLLSLKFSDIGEADGWYGPMTENVVKKIQRYLGLQQDGVVTSSTWNALFNPDDVIEHYCNDVSILNTYDLRRAYEYEDKDYTSLDTGGDATWYIEGKIPRYVRIIYEEREKKTVLIVYIVEKRYIVLATEYKYLTSKPFDDESAYTSTFSYYCVDDKSYEIKKGVASLYTFGEYFQVMDIIQNSRVNELK